MKTLFVVIPAYKEVNTLRSVVTRVAELPETTQIVIVNRCAQDQTRDVADQLALADRRPKIALYEGNNGNTEALKGFRVTLVTS